MDLSADQLKRAASIKEQITTLENQLNSLLGGGSQPKATVAKPSGMSEATRAKLRAASKAHWAKIRAGQGVATATSKEKKSASVNKGAAPAKKTATLSVAARKKISDAAKARWAKAKAAGRKSL